MKKILTFLSAAVISHGFSALAGLLLTRWLSVDQYAIYTVLALLTGTMTVLTTGGVHLAFSAIVGRTWPDRVRASQALAASLRERRLISAMVLPLFLLTAMWLLLKAGATGWLVASLLVLMFMQWHLDMKSRITDQILLYAQRAVGVQMLDTFLSILRLLAVVALQFTGFLSVLIVTAVGVVMTGLRVPFIQRWTRQELPAEPPTIIESDRREIRALILRQFPVEVFLCFQAQIALFILSMYATPADTASFGALGRLPQLFVPLSMLVGSYAIPRFSQQKDGVFRAFFSWSLVGLVPSLGLVAIAAFAPRVLLLLIGPNYANLQHEVFIASISSALWMFANTTWRLVANRGWNRWVLLQVPVFVLWCVSAPTFLKLSTLEGVLWFQLGFPLAILVATGADLFTAYRRHMITGVFA